MDNMEVFRRPLHSAKKYIDPSLGLLKTVTKWYKGNAHTKYYERVRIVLTFTGDLIGCIQWKSKLPQM